MGAEARRSERVEGLLEPAGVGLLRLGQGLEPVGDFLEAFLAMIKHSEIRKGQIVKIQYAGDDLALGEAAESAARESQATEDQAFVNKLAKLKLLLLAWAGL